jgi:hypothetical protein
MIPNDVFSSSLIHYILANLENETTKLVRSLNEKLDELIPFVCEISLKDCNLWTPSKTGLVTDEKYRANLMKEMGYSSNPKDRRLPVCMVSGLYGSGEKVVCGHIVPHRSDRDKSKALGLTDAEINSNKNLVFWARGIENAYEHLQLSFIRIVETVDGELRECFAMKIFDDSIRNLPLWDGCKNIIGEFEGCSLKLTSKFNNNRHEVLKRGLSFQAYQSYVHWAINDPVILQQCLFASPGKYKFRKEMDLLLKTLQKDIEEENEI